MMIALALVAVVFLAGFIVMAIGMKNAPEGFQTEHGFQIAWCNNDPEQRDVVCIWEAHTEQSATDHSSGLHAAA
jgi:hypothetical protein